MLEQAEQSKSPLLGNQSELYPGKVDTTEFIDDARLDFHRQSPHLGPVIATFNKISPFVKTPIEKPRSSAEQSVEYIASVGRHLALVRKDHMDKNWSLEDDYKTAHLDDQLDDQSKVA